MIARLFGLIVCLLVVLAGCVSLGETPVFPTTIPTAFVPTVSSAALPPAPATATPPPTIILPSETPVLATKTTLLTATASLAPVETAVLPTTNYTTRIIGYSAEQRPLTDHQFGNGPNHIVFVGGIHGGYEWNTILLAYDMIDYFAVNLDVLPTEVTLHIIPTVNPDGQFLVTGVEGRFLALDVAAESLPGRVNGRGVDLNRNWDCNWTANALWRDQPTSGGAVVFSEPETRALRDFLLELNPVAVIFWHSAANGVFAAGCPDVHQPSLNLATIYGRAAGYPVFETFTSYQVTGDAGDWLSLQGIAAISVELLNHESTDWSKNQAGVTAVLHQFNQINQ